MTRPSRAGTRVTPRRLGRSSRAPAGSSRSIVFATARSTIFISNSAKLAPRQRRTPPPNGIHV